MNTIKITAFLTIFAAFVTITTIKEKKSEQRTRNKAKTEQTKQPRNQ